MKPVYLDAAGEAVAGMFHAPEGTPSGVGVLLLAPFGWDDQSAFRPRRDWACALAAAGHAALRIDLPGSGDSAGSPRDPDRLGAWTAAAAAAAAWLRQGGAGRVTVIGMGLGGLVALSALADGTPIEDLVLWGVPARGRTLVRELKAFGRLEASQTGEDAGDVPADEIRAGGHVLTAQTAVAVSALDAAELLRQRAPERALLLGRDGMGPDEALRAALMDAGTAVDSDPGHGWGAALAGPQFAVTPWAVLTLTVEWLGAQRPGPAGLWHATAPATFELDVDGVAVRETALQFDVDGCRLFGVLAEPADGAVSAPGTAVLLNAGAIRHIGPNRMWTEAARRWAATGVPTLRLDVEAIGESDGDAEAYEDDAAFYVPRLTEQVRRVLDALVERGLPPRFLLAGLCSGAFWAFHAALADERVRCAVLLNPQLLFWDADAGPRRELRRALSVLTPSGFRALLRADRPFARILEIVRWLLAAALRRRHGGGDRAPSGDALHAALESLRTRDQRLELAFSGNEMLHAELAREGRLPDLERRGVAVHDLPHLSHTLKPLGAQAATHAMLDEALARALVPAVASAQPQ